MHFKTFFYILLILPLCVVAQDAKFEIQKAEDVLFQSPQQALDILDAAQNTQTLNTSESLQVLDITVRAYEALGQVNRSESALEQLTQLANQSGNRVYQGRALRHRGDLYYTSSEYFLAEQSHREALLVFRALADIPEMAKTLSKLSSAVRTQGNYQSAMAIAEEALHHYRQIDDLNGVTSSLIAVALAHKFLGNYAVALSSLQDSLTISLSIDDANTVADTYFNIASIYDITEDYIQAQDYYSRALKLDEAAGFKNDVAYDHVGLAEMASKLGNIAKAKAHIVKAYTLFTEIGSLRNQGWALIVEGKIEGMAGRFASANTLLSEGTMLAKQSEDSILIARGTMLLANLAYETQQFQEAVNLVDEVLSDAYSRDNAKQIEFLLEIKGKALAAQQKYEAALETVEALHAYRDQRNDQLRVQTIARLQNDIESQAKRHQIALLEKDRGLAEVNMQKVRTERNAVITTIVLLLLVVIIWAMKERERRRASSMRQIMLTEAAERKDALLADVSHELRTPLTVLRLHVESLQHDIADDPETTYKMLNSKIDELNKLIDDLYQLSLADSGGLQIQMGEVVARPFLQSVIDQHRPIILKAGLTLSSEISVDDEQQVSIDEQRIRQTITNIVSNSIRYTSHPGKIHITSRMHQGNWLISIADSSPGVDDNEMQRLFERMYRVEASRSRATGGAGLGLAICKTLIEAHHGRIKVAASDMGGLRVSLSIPAENRSNS